MRQWLGILKEAVTIGEPRHDRTGVGTLALFGRSLGFDCRSAFPAVTTKRLHFSSVAAELACFIRGYDSLSEFHEMGCNIWDKNAAQFQGQLGRIYGTQWRDWRAQAHDPEGGPLPRIVAVDQLQNLLDGLRKDPFGRRHLVTAWNPGELDAVCLPPCHVLFQCFLSPELGLSMTVYMRSADLFLGLPFDVASYALLLALLAKELGVSRDRLIFFLGDAHVYLNHLDQVKMVLSRKPSEPPLLWLDPGASLLTFRPSQARLERYTPQPAVPAPMNP